MILCRNVGNVDHIASLAQRDSISTLFLCDFGRLRHLIMLLLEHSYNTRIVILSFQDGVVLTSYRLIEWPNRSPKHLDIYQLYASDGQYMLYYD